MRHVLLLDMAITFCKKGEKMNRANLLLNLAKKKEGYRSGM